MDQSLSGGSGNPSRMTLTLIWLLRESSNMRQNYTMEREQTMSPICSIKRVIPYYGSGREYRL